MIRRLTILFALVLVLAAVPAWGAMTNRYVSSSGTASYTSCTSILTPTSFNAIFTSSTAGDYWWVANDGTYTRTGNDTMATAGTVGSPIIIEGYDGVTTGTGYLGRTNQGALITTNFPTIAYNATKLLTVSGAYAVLRNLTVTGSYNGNVIQLGGTGDVVFQCSVTNSLSNASASAMGSNSNSAISFIDCDAYATGATNANYAINAARASSAVINCRASNTASAGVGGILCNGDVIGNTVYSASGIGINLTASAGIAYGNTITGQATVAIQTPNSAQTLPYICVGNIITDNARSLLNQYNATAAHPLFWAFNRTRDNTSTDLGFGDWPYFNAVTTDTGGPETDFVSAATGDLRLILASPAVSAGPLGGEIGAIPRPKATLTTAGEITSGTQIGYAQDGLITGTFLIPATTTVTSATQYGAAGTEYTGVYGTVTADQVTTGVAFGPNNSLTGTAVTGTGGYSRSRVVNR